MIKSTHDAYENTWKCGELKLYFSSSAPEDKKKKKMKSEGQVAPYFRGYGRQPVSRPAI